MAKITSLPVHYPVTTDTESISLPVHYLRSLRSILHKNVYC